MENLLNILPLALGVLAMAWILGRRAGQPSQGALLLSLVRYSAYITIGLGLGVFAAWLVIEIVPSDLQTLRQFAGVALMVGGAGAGAALARAFPKSLTIRDDN